MLPRRPLDHRGVSEVIGSILVLLITVIIFSTIVLWVFTLPAPRVAGNVGIDGALEGRYVADMEGDGDSDIAAGSEDNRVYWWANDGTWTRTLIHTNQDDVRSLRVADMDGDFWDDIVISTEDGYIRWYRHDKGLVWNIVVIEQLGTRIYNIDVGDVDRGVVIDPSL